MSALAVAAALASFLIAFPASAAPMSLRAFAEQRLRVATIAYQISTEAATDCPDPQMVTGMLLHDLTSYDRNIRPAVSRAFSMGAGIGIVQIVRGSMADRARLRIDDEILAVNGRSVEDPSAFDQRRKSNRRLEAFSRFLQAALRYGPADLTIRRDGAIIHTWLVGEPGCGGEVALIPSGEENAWSDGNHVAVTTAMMQLARNDDELAFVIAHEMAHNMLGHSHSAKRGIFGLKFGGKKQELAADYMAVWLVTDGGYKAEGGIAFLQTAARHFGPDFSFDHPRFGTRIRTVAVAIAGAERSPVWARAHPGPVLDGAGGQLSHRIASSEAGSEMSGPLSGTPPAAGSGELAIA